MCTADEKLKPLLRFCGIFVVEKSWLLLGNPLLWQQVFLLEFETAIYT